VETAALRVRQPDYFDNVLRESVDKYFDQDVYEQVQQEQKEGRDKIRRMVEGELAKPE